MEGRSATVLLTGAAGFVGSATVRALAGTAPLRLLLHHPTDGAIVAAAAGTDVRYGDLTKPATLRGSCDGVGTVIHLANVVSDDEERCRAVNEFGTRSLLAQARRAGVRRVLYVSTSGVYGNATYSAAVETDLTTAPVSAASRSRLRAEELVRAAGGLVLRPHLIYGTGDRSALPGLLSLLRTIGGLPGGGHALQSVIDVDDLARIVATLAHADWRDDPAQTFHACHPEPVSLAEIAITLADTLGIDVPLAPVPLGQAGQRLRLAGVPLRELVRICQSHWSDPTSVWRRTGLSPGPHLTLGLARHAAWYAALAAPSGPDGAFPALVPLPLPVAVEPPRPRAIGRHRVPAVPDAIDDDDTVRLPP